MNAVSVRSGNADLSVVPVPPSAQELATESGDNCVAPNAFSSALQEARGKSTPHDAKDADQSDPGDTQPLSEPESDPPGTDPALTAVATPMVGSVDTPAAMLALLGQMRVPREPSVQELHTESRVGTQTGAIGALPAAPSDMQSVETPHPAGISESGVGKSDDTSRDPGLQARHEGVSNLPARSGEALAAAAPGKESALASQAADFAATLSRVAQEPSKGEIRDVTTPVQALNPAAGAVAAMPMRVEPAPLPSIAITSPVGTPYFVEETAQQVNWLVGNGIEQARINVTPNDMGPIEIHISMQNDEAMISFAVSQPETAAAIEDALPRLKEMLADSGVSLGQTSVGNQAQQFRDSFAQTADQRQTAGARHAGSDRELGAADATAARRPATGNRLVDLFA